MTKNKMIRVCEKFQIDCENKTSYVLVALTWHTTVEAAKRYYSKHNGKKDLMWAEHGVGMPYIPLYPRLAKNT